MELRDGDIDGVHVGPLAKHVDERGFLVEIFRKDTLPEGLVPAMSYLSSTEPGQSRGPHEHAEQTDIFGFVGPGNFKVYLWDNRPDSKTHGNRRIVYAGEDRTLLVIVPPGVVHGYKNISRTKCGVVVNFPDRLYAGEGKRAPVDEIRHELTDDQFHKDFLAR